MQAEIVEDISGAKRKKGKAKGVPNEVLDRHSADAATAPAECHPRLQMCRLSLSRLIENPPNGSIPMEIDSFMAEAMLERNKSNRHISEAGVRRYVDDLRNGKWKLNGETLKFTTDGTLGDGQHRLTAILKSKTSAWVDVRFGLDPDAIDTVDTGRKRTASDVLSRKGIKHSALVSAAAALIWRYNQKTRMGSSRPTLNQIEETIENHPEIHDIVRKANQAAKMLRAENLNSLSPSITAFVWTVASRKDQDKADQFFEQLVSGLNISDPHNPTKMLRRYVISNSGNRKVSPWAMAAVTVKAWNAFLKGQSIRELRIREKGDAPEKFPAFVD